MVPQPGTWSNLSGEASSFCLLPELKLLLLSVFQRGIRPVLLQETSLALDLQSGTPSFLLSI